MIPPVWRQLKAETTKTGKKDVLTLILDPSNVEDGEVNIFLRKQLVTDITTQNFGFGYQIHYSLWDFTSWSHNICSPKLRPNHNVPA